MSHLIAHGSKTNAETVSPYKTHYKYFMQSNYDAQHIVLEEFTMMIAGVKNHKDH